MNSLSILYCNKLSDCVLRTICESLNKFSKFYCKFWLFFLENFNKNLWKFDEILNFLLLSILIACWGVSCSPSFANFPGFQGRWKLPPSPWRRQWYKLIFIFFMGLFCAILLIETKFDYIFPKFLLKLVYSFKFSSCQI